MNFTKEPEMNPADDIRLTDEMERVLMIQAIEGHYQPQPLRAAKVAMAKLGRAMHQGLSRAAEARARNLYIPAH